MPFRDSPAPRTGRSNSEIDNFGMEISPKNLDIHKKLQKYLDISRTQEIKLESKNDLIPQDPEQFTKLATHSQQTVSLFRELARISREVDDLSEVQRKEEVNIQTYKKISTTLESVSASAASTIAPQLSRSLVTQAECKKIIEEKEKIMQRIWTDAVEAFVRDVTHEVDVSLQVALMSIRQEARQVGYSISGRSHKRQRDESDVGQSEEKEKNKKKGQQRDDHTRTQTSKSTGFEPVWIAGR